MITIEMTRGQVKAELKAWQEIWKTDLTYNMPYLNFVSDQIDFWRAKLKECEDD